MELRYRPRARTTRDLDLSIENPTAAATVLGRLSLVREELQTAAELDPGDYLRFTIAIAQTELQGAPLGGARFPCEATLAGKLYGRFHLDVGLGDASTGVPERLTGDSLLEFAGIPPAVVLAVPKAQQFAEKIHAYTFPWKDRTNTRTKDLVDLVLFIQTAALPEPAELRKALAATFARRATHRLPDQLPQPPVTWEADYMAIAGEAPHDACGRLCRGQRILAQRSTWHHSGGVTAIHRTVISRRVISFNLRILEIFLLQLSLAERIDINDDKKSNRAIRCHVVIDRLDLTQGVSDVP